MNGIPRTIDSLLNGITSILMSYFNSTAAVMEKKEMRKSYQSCTTKSKVLFDHRRYQTKEKAAINLFDIVL